MYFSPILGNLHIKINKCTRCFSKSSLEVSCHSAYKMLKCLCTRPVPITSASSCFLPSAVSVDQLCFCLHLDCEASERGTVIWKKMGQDESSGLEWHPAPSTPCFSYFPSFVSLVIIFSLGPLSALRCNELLALVVAKLITDVAKHVSKTQTTMCRGCILFSSWLSLRQVVFCDCLFYKVLSTFLTVVFLAFSHSLHLPAPSASSMFL